MSRNLKLGHQDRALSWGKARERTRQKKILIPLAKTSQRSSARELCPSQRWLYTGRGPCQKCILGAPGGLSQLSARLLISDQVTIPPFVRSSPAWDSELTAQSLLGILSPPLSLSLSLSLLSKINKHFLKKDILVY